MPSLPVSWVQPSHSAVSSPESPLLWILNFHYVLCLTVSCPVYVRFKGAAAIAHQPQTKIRWSDFMLSYQTRSKAPFSQTPPNTDARSIHRTHKFSSSSSSGFQNSWQKCTRSRRAADDLLLDLFGAVCCFSQLETEPTRFGRRTWRSQSWDLRRAERGERMS